MNVGCVLDVAPRNLSYAGFSHLFSMQVWITPASQLTGRAMASLPSR